MATYTIRLTALEQFLDSPDGLYRPFGLFCKNDRAQITNRIRDFIDAECCITTPDYKEAKEIVMSIYDKNWKTHDKPTAMKKTQEEVKAIYDSWKETFDEHIKYLLERVPDNTMRLVTFPEWKCETQLDMYTTLYMAKTINGSLDDELKRIFF